MNVRVYALPGYVDDGGLPRHHQHARAIHIDLDNGVRLLVTTSSTGPLIATFGPADTKDPSVYNVSKINGRLYEWANQEDFI